jgi:hypothetical protein
MGIGRKISKLSPELEDEVKPLFERLLGDDYDALPQPVRQLHDAPDAAVFRGTGTVLRGGFISSMMGFFASLPGEKDNAPLRVTIAKHGANETWRRDFASDVMVSELSERNGYLSEKLGPLRFSFALSAEQGAIVWRVHKVAMLGIPLPAALFGDVSAREYAVGDLYRFEVLALLPLVGRLIEYRGELQVDPGTR